MIRDIFILVLAMAMPPTPAQVPATDAIETPFKLTATAELVLLDVSVKDTAGEHISNLGKESFQVLEDGKLQRIAHFSSADVPVTVGLVIDTSDSMRSKYNDVVSAAMTFIGASNRSDEVFVVNFKDYVSRGLPAGVPFSSDLLQLRKALSWSVPEGRTALYDAVMLSLGHLQTGKHEKKALILVSDGGDNSSIHRYADVLRMVQESPATIYTIGLFDLEDHDRNPGLLRRVSHVSGGYSYFPEARSEVNEICRQIAADIRARYTIGYVPTRSGTQGALRKIKVTAEANGGHKLLVRTRTSYALPPEQPLAGSEPSPRRKAR